MANRWGIPKSVEEFVKQRDTNCVYCGKAFDNSAGNGKTIPSWEHIINDISINTADNIALCCISCNASKSSKLLKDWLNSNYCITKGITAATVAQVVKQHLERE